MKTSTSEQIELRIPRRAEFVRVARLAACAVGSQLDFTYDVVKDLELAVGEASANAVEHVATNEADDILVKFTIDEKQLTIEVIDKGQGFDPELEGKDALEILDEPGGLGLVVIREIMDEFKVSCDMNTGTCVRMVKYRR